MVFKGPLRDQTGAVKVAEGEVLTDDKMSAVDWFVEGVVGSPQ
jgi:basic membrane protein A